MLFIFKEAFFAVSIQRFAFADGAGIVNYLVFENAFIVYLEKIP